MCYNRTLAMVRSLPESTGRGGSAAMLKEVGPQLASTPCLTHGAACPSPRCAAPSRSTAPRREVQRCAQDNACTESRPTTAGQLKTGGREQGAHLRAVHRCMRRTQDLHWPQAHPVPVPPRHPWQHCGHTQHRHLRQIARRSHAPRACRLARQPPASSMIRLTSSQVQQPAR